MGRKRSKSSGAQWWAIGLVAVVVAVSGGLVAAALTPRTPPPSANGTAGTADYSGYFQSADDGQQTVVFIGDSYTAGDVLAPTDRTTARWPAVLAELTDSRELNYGYGGTGYTTAGPFAAGTTYVDRLAQIDTTSPDVVIVSGGRNDQDPATYAQSTAEFFPALRAKFPDAQIVAVEPFWDSSDYPGRLIELSALVQANVERVGGVYLAGPGQALIGHPEWVLEDAVHPNIDGHAQIAASVKEALDAAEVQISPTAPR